MINLQEVIETNKMIEQENLDVRTITMGISLLDCADKDLAVTCEKIYTKMLTERNILQKYGIKKFDCASFLCSEDTPENCHRRLLAEYMQKHSKEDVTIIHLI